MSDRRNGEVKAFVFKNRGALLAVPAAVLVAFGKPSVSSIVAGLAIAVIGELIRCWAVGYSGVTTRDNAVIAPALFTAGPYAYVRNPLYVGNFVTALGFAIAFVGSNAPVEAAVLIVVSLAWMIAVYATIIPHEERYLRSQFGAAFDAYCAAVPPIFPHLRPAPNGNGTWNPSVIWQAETQTFVTFAVMLAFLAVKALI